MCGELGDDDAFVLSLCKEKQEKKRKRAQGVAGNLETGRCAVERSVDAGLEAGWRTEGGTTNSRIASPAIDSPEAST